MPISFDTNAQWGYQFRYPGKDSIGNSDGTISATNSRQISEQDLSQRSNEQRLQTIKQASRIECQTCKTRKYQDGSNDPGVSFKSAAHIDPGNSSAVVMSHEQEHVRNETAKAAGAQKEIVSQTVSLETSVCPECGRVYTSGGKTRTVTKSKNIDKDFVAEYYDRANQAKTTLNLSIKT
jgi:hypothetical protein